jgi:hypoxanthine phosphoribosyltransferase
MGPDSYAYSHRREVLPVSWDLFHGLCKGLAAAAAAFAPDWILAIGRGGFYPGTLLAHLLQVELFPIRLSRRVRDAVVYTAPRWIVAPPAILAGQNVLIVDEISSTGETLRMARERVAELNPRGLRTAVLYAHSTGVEPADYIGIMTDALVLNPWDREVWSGSGFQLHPEYREALEAQGLAPGREHLLSVEAIAVAKTP